MKLAGKRYLAQFLSLLGICLGDYVFANQTSSLPNIVIILADDMGYGDVQYLNPQSKTLTPAIDKLAQNGIVFTDAHASASVCTPSRYGLLTGRYAFRSPKAANGIWGFDGPVIEPDRETLASMLQKAGYTTACIGKWHLGIGWQTKNDGDKPALDKSTGFSNVDYSKNVSSGPNDYGFDYSFIHPASLDIPPYVFIKNHEVVDKDIILTTDHYPSRKPDTQYAWDKKHTDSMDIYWEKGIWWRRGEMSRSFRIEDCHSVIVNEGVDFINRQAANNSGNPFFLYLPLTGPHTPWMPSEKFKGKTTIGAYGDFVMDIDDVVRKISAALEANSLDSNTILIFTSDNGAYWPEEEIELQQHDSNAGRRGQKGDIWEGGHRIPLIITWPEKVKQPYRYNHLVSLTDLFSTFKELSEQVDNISNTNDSYSFLHALKSVKNAPVRPNMIHHSSKGMYAIRKDNWKYIDGLGSGGFTDPSTITPENDGPRGQLYDLNFDETESHNRYQNSPDIVATLKSTLEEVINHGAS
ncbi:MAG TPA: arylsulfatase, partial [Mariniphaga sp.]|nr:arylsulfatase [Mariniphaga sp.]